MLRLGVLASGTSGIDLNNSNAHAYTSTKTVFVPTNVKEKVANVEITTTNFEISPNKIGEECFPERKLKPSKKKKQAYYLG